MQPGIGTSHIHPIAVSDQRSALTTVRCSTQSRMPGHAVGCEKNDIQLGAAHVKHDRDLDLCSQKGYRSDAFKNEADVFSDAATKNRLNSSGICHIPLLSDWPETSPPHHHLKFL